MFQALFLIVRASLVIIHYVDDAIVFGQDVISFQRGGHSDFGTRYLVWGVLVRILVYVRLSIFNLYIFEKGFAHSEAHGRGMDVFLVKFFQILIFLLFEVFVDWFHLAVVILGLVVLVDVGWSGIGAEMLEVLVQVVLYYII